MATLLKEIAVGNAVGTWYLRLYEDRITQDVATNISTVYWRLTLRCSVVGASISFDSRDAWINTSHFTIAYSHSGAEHDLGTGSALIGHNADGTGSYSVGFGISTSYALSGSAMGGRTLPTIPRASSFTLSGNSLGSAITVNISRASASFTHTVKYQFGNIVREYTGQATTCSFTPPLSDASQIPNNTSGVGSIILFTYNGGTLIGTTSSSITLNLPESVIPTFSSLGISRVDNGVPAAWGIYVQGKSKATLTIVGASGIYGSSIKSYSISGGGYTTSSSSFTTGILGAGTISFTATITDSRGRSASKSVSITVYENSSPSLTVKAERCNSSGVSSNTGTYLKITPTYGCASIGGKNSIATKSFKIAETSYANTAAASGAGFVLGNNDITISKSYIVTGVVTDALGQSSGTMSFTVSSSAVPFNLRNDGAGVAFGKYAETTNLLDSAWPVKTKKLTTNSIRLDAESTEGDQGLIDFYQAGTVIAGIATAPNKTGIRLHAYYNGKWETWIDFLYNVTCFHHNIEAGAITTSDWFYSSGNNGWYNTKWGGGINMSDSTYVRISHGKKFYVDNSQDDAINTSGGIYSGQKMSSLGFYNRAIGAWTVHSNNINLFTDINNYLEIRGGNYAKGIYYTVSDIKFKKDVKPTSIISAMCVINQLEHVQFSWIDSGNHVDIGYIANDVKDIMSDLTFNVKQPDGSDQYNINQTTLLPLITKGMQELCEENRILEKRIEDLEKKMSVLISKEGSNQ